MSHLKETDLKRSRTDGRFIFRYDPMDRMVSVEVTDNGEFEPTELQFPLRVVTEINSMCNMRCSYCSQHEDIKGPKLKTENVLNIIDQANTGKVFELSLRGGEATLHPDFKIIWEHATAQDFTSANLITNGLVLNEQKALGLLSNERSKIVVSLDGPEEINSRFRDPRQYKKVMEWLVPVLATRGDQITILSCVYKQNLPYLPDFCNYLSQLGLRHHHFTLLKRLGSDPLNRQKFCTQEQVDEFQNTLNEISSVNPHYLPTINSPMTRVPQNNKNMFAKISMPNFTEYFCGTGIKIMADGKIGISQIIFLEDASKKSGGHVDNRIGTVGEPLQKVWDRSLQMRKEQSQWSKDKYRHYLGLE